MIGLTKKWRMFLWLISPIRDAWVSSRMRDGSPLLYFLICTHKRSLQNLCQELWTPSLGYFDGSRLTCKCLCARLVYPAWWSFCSACSWCELTCHWRCLHSHASHNVPMNSTANAPSSRPWTLCTMNRLFAVILALAASIFSIVLSCVGFFFFFFHYPGSLTDEANLWLCYWLGPAQDVHFLYTRSHLSGRQIFALTFWTNFQFIFIFK